MHCRLCRTSVEIEAGGLVLWRIPAAAPRPSRLATDPRAFTWQEGGSAAMPAPVSGFRLAGRVFWASLVAWIVSIAAAAAQLLSIGLFANAQTGPFDLAQIVTGLFLFALVSAPFTAAGAILVTPLTVLIARKETPPPSALIVVYGLAGYAAGLLIFGAMLGGFSRAGSSALLAVLPAAAYGWAIGWVLRPEPAHRRSAASPILRRPVTRLSRPRAYKPPVCQSPRA